MSAGFLYSRLPPASQARNASLFLLTGWRGKPGGAGWRVRGNGKDGRKGQKLGMPFVDTNRCDERVELRDTRRVRSKDDHVLGFN